MSVSIIGCGWLGQALAKALLADDIAVLASYQSPTTLAKLKQLKIPAQRLVLPIAVNDASIASNAALASVTPDFFNHQVLVIAIPPQLKKGRLDYPLKIQQLVKLAELGQTKHIIFLNSTAIYNGLEGQVAETSTLNLAAEKVAILAAAEQALQLFSGRVDVLRLAGLVGPNRHPGKFLQHQRLFKNAEAAVNLVHQRDVVNIIKLLLTKSSEHGFDVYNVVSATNASRQQYYQAAAKALGLATPQFEQATDHDSGKQVLGTKLRQGLAYQYCYDDLLAWAAKG
ncbi:Nucleoside-diphosphate-sugar epimerase [Colwellia chukchiensis]|uniref:Nucleoside-diphosphate-sugar epimerase n=1 Tax=Colwellia chukchiensis TaxID=641665 RepID=A0A1H7RFB1_9GAMM|nr:hypothetical protein [Colwellia chukchiensis]SEL58842.1 Nucleoside-diphosphate-sugar epimerase [Colwellia chukchiensis]